MSLWTITLALGFLAVIILNLVFQFAWSTVLDLLFCAIVIMLPAAVFLFVGRKIPRKYFDTSKKSFKDTSTKQKICNAIKVKSWKDKIPVGGRVAGFRMNKLDRPKDVAYLDRYVYESCFADWLHSIIAIWSLIGAGLIFVAKRELFFRIALPFALLFCYQNICSVLIQWYMRPRIEHLRANLAKRQEEDDDNLKRQTA